jgi:Holliday junction resolvase-like predicted endonuclease
MTGIDGARRTPRQLAGDAAEALVAERLAAHGWLILGRNVHAGRSELDIVAADPGPPARLVVVEVRCRGSRDFGGAEGSFDFRKRANLRRGIARLVESGRLPDGTPLPPHPFALDLAVVEPRLGGGFGARLYRDVLAG